MNKHISAVVLVTGLTLVGVTACSSEQATDSTTDSASSSSASVDAGVGEFPAEWPADLTVIPGFTLASASVTADGLSAQMTAEGDETEAVRTYALDLQANQGWAVDPSLPPGANGMWALTKEGKVVTMFSAAAGNQTVVIFSITDR